VNQSRVTRKHSKETRENSFGRKVSSVVARDYSRPDPLKRKSCTRYGASSASSARSRDLSLAKGQCRKSRFTMEERKLRSHGGDFLSPFPSPISKQVFVGASHSDRPSKKSSRREGVIPPFSPSAP